MTHRGVSIVAFKITMQQILCDLVDIQAALLAADQNLDLLMTTVAEGVLRVVSGADGAVIEMRDQHERACRAASGIAAPFVGARRCLSGSLFEHCMTSGEAQLCMDVEKSSYIDVEACRAVGIKAIILAPVLDHGEVTGVVKIFTRTQGAFGEQDLLVAKILAGAITAGLARIERDAAYSARDSMAARFEATFDQAAVGIAHVDLDGAFLLVNDRFCQIAGHARDELLHSGFQKITHPEDLNADLGNVDRLLAGEMPSYAMEKRYIRSDASLVWVNLTVSLVRNRSGGPEFFVAVIEDISPRKTAEHAASRDPLTGLRNRRWLEDNFDRWLFQQEERPTVLAYLDVDGFKLVNDRFGHAEGDRCLRDIADCFEAALTPNDVVCRIAGDEFVILMSAAIPESAARTLENLSKSVRNHCRSRPWSIDLSVGAIVVDPAHKPRLDDLLEAADQLMYRAKQTKSGALFADDLGKDLAA